MAGSSCCLPQTLAAKLKLVPSHYDVSTNALTAEGGGAGTLPPPPPPAGHPAGRNAVSLRTRRLPRLGPVRGSASALPASRQRRRPPSRTRPSSRGASRAPQAGASQADRGPHGSPALGTGRFSAILTCALRQMLLKGSETETVNWKKRRVLDRLFLIFSPMFVSTVEG